MNATVSTFVKERIEVFEKKKAVDSELLELKHRIERAKERAYTHREFIPRDKFRELVERHAGLRDESQALQMRLHEIRAEEKAANKAEAARLYRASHERKQRRIAESIAGQSTFLKALLALLKARMTGAEYDALMADAKRAEQAATE